FSLPVHISPARGVVLVEIWLNRRQLPPFGSLPHHIPVSRGCIQVHAVPRLVFPESFRKPQHFRVRAVMGLLQQFRLSVSRVEVAVGGDDCTGQLNFILSVVPRIQTEHIFNLLVRQFFHLILRSIVVSIRPHDKLGRVWLRAAFDVGGHAFPPPRSSPLFSR